MSRRASTESIILNFFRTAPLDVAESILRLAQGEVKQRRPLAVPAKSKRIRKPRPSNVAELSAPQGA